MQPNCQMFPRAVFIVLLKLKGLTECYEDCLEVKEKKQVIWQGLKKSMIKTENSGGSFPDLRSPNPSKRCLTCWVLLLSVRMRQRRPHSGQMPSGTSFKQLPDPFPVPALTVWRLTPCE
ncbi:uncharacterized protein PS065_022784 [Dugong dugon]